MRGEAGLFGNRPGDDAVALKETVERLRTSRSADETAGYSVAKWQDEVSRLYDRIGQWLSPYLEDGGIILERTSKTVVEERTGPYEVYQLDIEVGDEVVRLDPIGTVVIGARGRIDMSHLGGGDPRLLVLVGGDDQPHWALVDPARRSELTVLTAESFEAALDRLLDRYGVSSGLPM